MVRFATRSQLAEKPFTYKETVLFVLLDRFKFTPGSKEVYWNMVGVATPSADRGMKSARSSMVLTVSRAN